MAPVGKEPPKSLDEYSLMAAAQAKIGLSDYGDDGGSRASLRKLVSMLAEDPDLSQRTRETAFDVVLDQLIERLKLVDDRKRFPGIARERIERPVFAMGQGRSGTTFLHSLLAEDPASRGPRYWEAMYPSPPLGMAPPEDPRIARANKELTDFIALNHRVLRGHPYWDQKGLSLVECNRMQDLDFRSYSPTAYFRIPSFRRWDLGQDPQAFYAFHKRLLQHLQFRAPARRWALKSPQHQRNLDALLAEYPDAILVWTHREPAEAVPSMLEHIATIADGINGRRTDRKAMAAENLAIAVAHFQSYVDSPFANDKRVFHVRYPDLTRDPVGTVRRIYDHFALPFTGQYEERLRAFLADPATKADRHGKLEYSIEPFGLTPAQFNEKFRPYREKFLGIR